MFWETVTDSCDVCQCTSLFKNAFTIKSTPESSMSSKSKARRLLGMASRRFSSTPLETVSPSINKENGSATSDSRTSSPQKISSNGKRLRFPLEDCDPNSQDSGYGASYPDRERDGFQFAEPLGVAPRRMSVESRSPMQSPIRLSPLRQKSVRSSIFRSLSSGYESTDDGFNDLIDIETLDDATQLPNGITSLLSASIMETESMMECDISTTPEFPRIKSVRNFRRSLSLQNDLFYKHQDEEQHESSNFGMSKVRSCLFRSPTASCSTAELGFDDVKSRGNLFGIDSVLTKSFKRPEPPAEVSPQLVKRSRKSNSFQDIPEDITIMNKPLLQRSFSETEAHANIKSAIHRSTTDSDLTGDFSKQCVLPLATGRHEDLKSISVKTLADVMRGNFKDFVNSFTIVDCRYPYEYNAGHIKGALNLYSKDMIEQQLLNPLTNAPEIEPDTNKRSILVFHCEFSWERGPNLSRFLRNIDRQRNKEHYPALHYPEVYLLHGGYEQFFKEQRELCSPQDYRPMRHPDNEADLKQFRNKSRSWQGDKPRINGLITRTNLKRLGF